MYELLTGQILFNPHKKKGFNRDRYHLYQMQCKLGKIPSSLLDKSDKKRYYFKQNGNMKGCVYNISYQPFYEDIKKRYELDDKTAELDQTLLNAVDLLKNMFEYNPVKRFKASECLKHPFFN